MRAIWMESSSPRGPNAKPIIAVIASGSPRFRSHGHGLRSVRRKSFAIKMPSRFISFPEVPASELQKHIVQARPLEHHVFSEDGKLQQIPQAFSRIALANCRNRNL